MTIDEPGGARRGAREEWDARAASFDDEPDHGLRDPLVRRAWADRLADWLPGRPGAVLDVGCGTGSLSLLASESGHRVTGVDLSPTMVALARAKLAGRDARFLVGDASAPPVSGQRFDAVLARHVLWTLPDPARTLRGWYDLLRPGGRLVLVEGVWGAVDPVGISAERLTSLLAPIAPDIRLERLSDDPALWGGPVADERYAVLARASRDDRGSRNDRASRDGRCSGDGRGSGS
ncbi:methyltransferase domain-containing protein [Streptomyces sp. DSM 41014]|uniref:Methyltransferase domain-containing protein n=1 Tax=Streptomyces hintoniae TaxID=3075521 RepID=A0ABU2UQB2_9ACTN|nr:methyltransferase domain-containing protein [Streptomyces sp. DSM 41014]MDT0475318.1 methyltransferase domain-containing protein [Streptomyces sp. DSM 41014]